MFECVRCRACVLESRHIAHQAEFSQISHSTLKQITSYAFASVTFRMDDKQKTKIQLKLTLSGLATAISRARQERMATELNQTSLSIDMGNQNRPHSNAIMK